MADEISFSSGILSIIETSRNNALKKVNEELINMYWNVGKYLHEASQSASFGDSYIDTIATDIQTKFPGIKGFNRRGLYRMKNFYEVYKDDEFVTTLLTQISWSNHLAILSLRQRQRKNDIFIFPFVLKRIIQRENWAGN